jgi:DNA-binding protein HU-beta
MNKAELIAALAKDSKLSKANAEKILNTMMIIIVSKSLKKGEKVSIPGFVTISKVKRSARNGRNLQTGKEIKIAARSIAKFKAGKALTDSLK